jgi:hypothetical protein
MLARGWLGLMAALLAACAGKSEGSPTTETVLSPCDPFAAITLSVSLDASRVLAAGRAQDGSLYVIDRENRLFVGSDDALEEREVLGLGESADQTDLQYTDDDGMPVTVELMNDGASTQITVARGMQSGKGIDAGNGEALSPVDAALVAKLSASTTQRFQIDFGASLSDGRELVVVAPTHAGGYEQFRVFLGPPTALAQQLVTNFFSSLSGQRSATVVVDGAAADLTYLAGGPSVFNPAGGPSTITIAGTDYPLTEGSVPASASYFCLPN